MGHESSHLGRAPAVLVRRCFELGAGSAGAVDLPDMSGSLDAGSLLRITPPGRADRVESARRKAAFASGADAGRSDSYRNT
jgi:hypothetical protein